MTAPTLPTGLNLLRAVRDQSGQSEALRREGRELIRQGRDLLLRAAETEALEVAASEGQPKPKEEG